MHYEFIDSETGFSEFRAALTSESCIAVDTEFVRETTYYPLIGLVQIAGRDRIACIDPLAFDAVPLLSSLLLNPAITKVFHSCEQDLEVLELMLGGLPCPVYDTQLAEGLLCEHAQLSYAALVTQRLGVELPKSHTRTDWLRRPLRDGPLEYAADDVRYLQQIREQQLEQLRSLHRLDWLAEECGRLCSRSRLADPDFSSVWHRVRDKQELRGIELAILRETADWRERHAMAENRTRRKILPDEMLLKIARGQMNNSSRISGIRGIERYLSPEQIVALADRVQAAMAVPAEHWPELKRPRMTPQQSLALKSVLDRVRERAQQLGIASGMLCNRKDAEKLVLGERELTVLQGWRLAEIGEELLRACAAAS